MVLHGGDEVVAGRAAGCGQEQVVTDGALGVWRVMDEVGAL